MKRVPTSKSRRRVAALAPLLFFVPYCAFVIADRFDFDDRRRQEIIESREYDRLERMASEGKDKAGK
jgi:hypothetical protein